MGVLEDRFFNDDKKRFYQSIGGSYICTKCGQILTLEQKEESEKATFISLMIIVILTFMFFLLVFLWPVIKRKKGCPICSSDNILLITSNEGRKFFQIFHPDYVDLLSKLDTPNKEEII